MINTKELISRQANYVRQELPLPQMTYFGEEIGAEGELTSAWLLLLEHALALWATQRDLLGPLHPEGALTLHDIACAIRALLARDARALYAAHPQWSSADAASRAEQRAEELHRAIAALYGEAWREAL